jgi:diacylglycerol kinase family enzyme
MGKLAYPMTAASEAWKLEPFRVALRTPERAWELQALQVVVANGRFMGGGRITHPEAMLDDRLLSVYVVTAPEEPQAAGEEDATPRLQRLWRLLRVGLLLGRGRHLALPQVEHFQTRSLELSTEPALAVNADGELVGRAPMAFGVAPGALRVLVPNPSPSTAPGR